MKKLTLLATTALMLSIAPAMANENQSWIDTMTTSVQNWWSGNDETAEVEAYLDEVTIAVPPMTGEEAAQIQPAAGDYVEEVQEEIQNAPGSMMNDEQSFNTDFSAEGSVTAFEDNAMSADDMANIMPAAGDAEEIVDESVVVVEHHAEEATEEAADMMDDAQETTQETMDEAEETAEDAVDATVEGTTDAVESTDDMVDDAWDATKDMASDISEGAQDMADDAMDATGDVMDAVEETTKDAVDATVETTNDVMDDAHDMMDDHTSHDH